jgi:predicted SAM-dependent methyltransferase
MPENIKLNLGGGDRFPLPGFLTIDAKTGGQVYPLAEYADNSVDEIRASHILEHFPFEATHDVVKEWVRVLKPGGVIKIAVPDFDAVVDAYCKGDPALTEQYVMGGHRDGNDAHAAIFNRAKLTTIMRMSGLVRVEPWKSEVADCASLPVSLNLSGVKITPRKTLPRIAFCLSAPRFGLTSTWMSISQAVGTTPNAIIHSATGAYWGQCLERIMSKSVEEGAEYIITLDYDTVFTPGDVHDLIWLANGYPEADAIAPMQQARGWERPLLNANGTDAQPIAPSTAEEWRTRPLIEAGSAHFGLTLFRAASLANFPHPWFHGRPNAAGEWGDGRIDDDIAFWHGWRARGLRLFVAPRVVVGHIVEAVTWPAEDMTSALQMGSDYQKNGKPKGVWK